MRWRSSPSPSSKRRKAELGSRSIIHRPPSLAGSRGQRRSAVSATYSSRYIGSLSVGVLASIALKVRFKPARSLVGKFRIESRGHSRDTIDHCIDPEGHWIKLARYTLVCRSRSQACARGKSIAAAAGCIRHRRFLQLVAAQPAIKSATSFDSAVIRQVVEHDPSQRPPIARIWNLVLAVGDFHDLRRRIELRLPRRSHEICLFDQLDEIARLVALGR